MAEYDIEFFEYLAQAELEALNDRESKIFELRYGLTGGNPCTLAAIGELFGLSRERIRQILCKCHKKIISKGQRQIKANTITFPCAELLIYVRSIILPQKINSVEIIIEFSRNNLSCLPQETHALPLMGYLIYPSKINRKENIERAKKLLQEFEVARRRDSKQQNLLSRFQKLLSYVIYPGDLKYLDKIDFNLFSRKREVSLVGEGNAGSFYSQKLNRMVQYESSLEMNFLLYLENVDEVVFYQEQPVRLTYEFEENISLYYPDFLFVLKDGRGIIVEIKPVFKMALKENLAKWSALKKYCVQHGLGLLVTDGRSTIQEVQRHEIKTDFSRFLLEKLHHANINWTEYKEIKEQFNPSTNDFVALVLRNKLTWKLSPFFLSLGHND